MKRLFLTLIGSGPAPEESLYSFLDKDTDVNTFLKMTKNHLSDLSKCRGLTTSGFIEKVLG